jgi:hypothetical protein
MLQRSKGFTSNRILMLPFGTGRFTNWGSRDNGLTFISTGLRRPVPVGPVRSKGCLRSMRRLVFPKFQGLFHLAKIELLERKCIKNLKYGS